MSDLISHRNFFTTSIAVMRSLSLVIVALVGPTVRAQLEISDPDEAVIHYHSDEGLSDPVARLQSSLATRQTSLQFTAQRGYLDAVLKEFGINPSSQGLAFSKSSSQAERTSPRTPRAVYFNDNVSVAWVPGAPVIDIAAVDPQRGPIFYTLEQKTDAAPRFIRNADCLRCHSNPQTVNVPGLLVRSFYTSEDGTPLAKVPRFVSGHNSALDLRWGGWYVTGTHENDLHLGNVFSTDRQHPEQVNVNAGANVTDLSDRVDLARYPSRHSDIVALLVLEHQSRMQNLITRANYETRLALDPGVAEGEKRTLNPEGGADSPRIIAAGEALLEYMLFINQAPLKGQVKGTSSFVADFEKQGIRDSHGRSLREFELTTRLFRYRCSYMIYAAAFEGLPAVMKNYLWKRLDQILAGKDGRPAYASMDANDRRAVREILIVTKPEYAAWVRAHESPGQISRGKIAAR